MSSSLSSASSPFLPLPPPPPPSVQISINEPNAVAPPIQSFRIRVLLVFSALLSFCSFGLLIPDDGIFDGPCLSLLGSGLLVVNALFFQSKLQAGLASICALLSWIGTMILADHLSGLGLSVDSVSPLTEAAFVLQTVATFFVLLGFSQCRWPA